MPGTKDVHLALESLQTDCGLLPVHPTVLKFRALSQQMSLETVSVQYKRRNSCHVLPQLYLPHYSIIHPLTATTSLCTHYFSYINNR